MKNILIGILTTILFLGSLAITFVEVQAQTRKMVITPENFDGKKFAQRYGLSSGNRDFYVKYDDAGIYWLYLSQGVTISDANPIIEAPDAVRPIRTLRNNLKSRDLSLPEVNQLLRLERGL